MPDDLLTIPVFIFLALVIAAGAIVGRAAFEHGRLRHRRRRYRAHADRRRGYVR